MVVKINYDKVAQKINETTLGAITAKCIECKICEMVCSLYHEGDGINPKNGRITIVPLQHRWEILPMVCRFCEDAPCVASCPDEALSRNKEKHIIMVNDEKCNGCGACVKACPYGGIKIHPVEEKAIVCDHCNGEFLCVKYCPENILEFLKAV